MKKAEIIKDLNNEKNWYENYYNQKIATEKNLEEKEILEFHQEQTNNYFDWAISKIEKLENEEFAEYKLSSQSKSIYLKNEDNEIFRFSDHKRPAVYNDNSLSFENYEYDYNFIFGVN